MTALILHGGAGARRERNYDAEVVHMREVVEAMKVRLDAGDSALDVATAAVVMLEDSGLYVAGKGASPNLAGAYELDASIMQGHTRRAGAVAGVTTIRNPIALARRALAMLGVARFEAGDFAAAPANALIDMVYALGAGYRANATWIMNSRLAGMVRRMRDGDGRYLLGMVEQVLAALQS